MQRPRPTKKFSISPIMDFRSKIRDVLAVSECSKHAATYGVPCFDIPRDTGGYYAGICQKRINKVYDGPISETSVSNKRPKKEKVA